MVRARFVRLLVFVALLTALSAASFAGVFVSITVAPPPLPVYVQPACPGPDYMWTPGYWAWGEDGYYWVPGTWVVAPEPGLLWTPGYWGWSGGAYLWHAGYWGPHVGFYGGVNYGFGYGGVGFVGGEWRHGAFFYNSAVMNVGGPHITNVYVNRTVIVNERNVTRVSYNGGNGGIRRMPSPSERAAERDHHMMATEHQMQHENTAAHNPQMFVRNNNGRPSVAATARPGEFSRDAVPARAAGGRVPPASMNANSRTMPPAHTNAPQATRGNQTSNTNRGAYNQQQNQRPAMNNTPQRGYNQPSNTARPSMQQPQRSTPQTQQRQAPAPQAQRSAPPAQRSAPQPQQHNQGGQQNRGGPEHEEHRH